MYKPKQNWRKHTRKTSFINRHRYFILLVVGYFSAVAIFTQFDALQVEAWQMGQTTLDTPKASPSPVLSVEDTIRQVAQERGFKDVDNLIRLFKCESGLRPDAYHVNVHKQSNGTILTTLDRGLGMFNDHWRADVSNTCSWDVACATNEAITTINARGGYDRWACAKKLGL